MSTIQIKDPEQHLSLLAANLRSAVKLTSRSQEGTVPADSGKLCPLLFQRDLLRASEQCTDDGVPVLLDWLNRLDRAVIPDAWTRLMQQTTKDDNNEAEQNTIWLRQTLLANQTSALEGMLPRDETGAWRQKFSIDGKGYTCGKPPSSGLVQSDIPCLLKKLVSIDNDMAKLGRPSTKMSYQQQWDIAHQLMTRLEKICTGIAAERDGLLCDVGKALVSKYDKEFEIATHSYITGNESPLLEMKVLDEGRKAILLSIYDAEENIGFTNVNLKDAKNDNSGLALIIGVVGEETTNAISSENKSVCYKIPSSNLSKREVADCDSPNLDPTDALYKVTINVTRPLPTVEAILRAADVRNPGQYKYRIVMAQMPQTQAEELAVRIRDNVGVPADNLGAPSVILPAVDLILSEAQPDHASPNMTFQYESSFDKEHWTVTPVVAPRPTWDTSHDRLVRPDSSVTIATTVAGGIVDQRQVTNEAIVSWTLDQGANTTVYALMKAVEDATRYQSVARSTEFFNGLTAAKCASDMAPEDCKLSVRQFVLKRMRIAGNSDVAMLEDRDLFLSKLLKGYEKDGCACPDNKKTCNSTVALTGVDLDACHLRAEMDRVLWKGDYYERVMLSGKDLASLMSTAAEQSNSEQTLMPRDTFNQWLVTYGIVTAKPNVLTRSGVRSCEFSIPQSAFCADADEQASPSAGGTSLYCVNGLPLQSDHAYSLATTDHLAEDTAVYKTIAGLTKNYREGAGDFLVDQISGTIVPTIQDSTSLTPSSKAAKQKDQSPRALRNREEINHQIRDVFQVDIGKAVLGYSLRTPQGGDPYVAKNFQGVTDSRANSPYQSEIDLEEKSRAQWKRNWFALGVQTNMVYDRSVLGNLSGNPVNASYPLNNVIVGGFLQWNLNPPRPALAASSAIRNLPRSKYSLIFAPYQYQRQINGSYLFFPFSPATKPAEQMTLQLPPVNGFSQRAGFRWESAASKQFPLFDKGTYGEIGGQLIVQNNVLAVVTVTTSGQPALVCASNSTVSLSNCFSSAKYPVNSSSAASAAVQTLHGGGLYWDIHLQKALAKLADNSPGISLVIDTQGNKFVNRGPGKALSTQTLYDVPLSVALTFPLFRNLSFAPTYSAFFYANQVLDQTLTVNSFAVNFRWYYDRDSGVPLYRQLLFKGPASADETKTAKIK